MLFAAGTLGKPGIVIISPVNATKNPAPIDGFNSRIVIVNPSGRPNNVGSSDNEYCVFAIQIGSLSHPFSTNVLICVFALDKNSTFVAP